MKVLPPDVNRSEALFTAEQDPVGTWVIPYALAAIKGTGRAAMASVARERNENGPYKDIFDFARRTDPTQVNKRSIEALAKAGAFDAIHPNRAQAFAAADVLSDYAALSHEEATSNQESLFGGADIEVPPPKLPDVDDWPALDRLTAEMEAIGFYLSGHPLDDYSRSLKRARVVTYEELLGGAGRHGKPVRIAGTVMERFDRKSKSGKPFAFVRASDPTGEYEATVFSDVLAVSRDLFEPGRSIVMSVTVDHTEDGVRPLIQSAEPVDSAVADAGAGLKVFIESAEAYPGIKACLGNAGKGIVTLVVMADEGLKEVHMDLPGRYKVDPKVRAALKSLKGVAQVEEI